MMICRFYKKRDLQRRFLERLKRTDDTDFVDILVQLEGGLIGKDGSAPSHPHSISRSFQSLRYSPNVQPWLGSAFA